MDERLPLLIDCDPGIDDTLAIWAALRLPGYRLDGITTMAGTVPVGATTRNARHALSLAGAQGVPVHAGAAAALDGFVHSAEINHGEDGLGRLPPLAETALPPVGVASAEEFLVDYLGRAAQRSVTILSLAPKTNLARALMKAPHIAQAVREIVMMAGAMLAGNTTATAEFNAYVDPAALDMALRADWPVTLIPFDAAKGARATAARRADLRASGGLGATAADLLDSYVTFDETLWGTDGGALPDPLCVAHLARPELFTTRRVEVGVECASPLLRGTTLIDWHGYHRWLPDAARASLPVARVAGAVDAAGFYGWLGDMLGDRVKINAPGERAR